MLSTCSRSVGGRSPPIKNLLAAAGAVPSLIAPVPDGAGPVEAPVAAAAVDDFFLVRDFAFAGHMPQHSNGTATRKKKQMHETMNIMKNMQQ